MNGPKTHAPEPLGVPTRRAAIRLLDAVLRRGEPLEAALAGATRQVHGPDRGLAHAIAAEVLRRLPDLDQLIDQATARPLPPDAKARMALRVALAQVLVLGTPAHAAIATVLPLVDGGPRRLVHGVFGTILRGGMLLPEAPTLPERLAARWEAAWGWPMVEATQAAIAAPPPLDLTLADPDATGEWRARLGGESLAPGHLRIVDHPPVPEMPGYAEGAWWVQDVAASIPARMIGPGDGRALDLCAAPGGKTLQLAHAGWRTVAVDGSKARLRRLRENLHRTRAKVDVVQADIRAWDPGDAADLVLLDAPCSASGIVRRHPDTLHRATDASVVEMAALQTRLLVHAADWVRPGGTLVYATCSLEPEEGEAQIERFLASNDRFALVPPEPSILPDGVAADERGWVRTFPGTNAARGGMDGFFAARLVRRG